jgi:hypothetical protein
VPYENKNGIHHIGSGLRGARWDFDLQQQTGNRPKKE